LRGGIKVSELDIKAACASGLWGLLGPEQPRLKALSLLEVLSSAKAKLCKITETSWLDSLIGAE
jgi:hypothetical protein